KRKTILFVVPIIVAVLFLTVFFVSHKILASLEGWGSGIWNNYIEGHAQNDPNVPPTIGWLSSNSELSGCGGALSKKYSINFGEPDEETGERPVYGSAWFGVGSKEDSNGACDSDLPSLGWLNFSVGYPSFCSGDDCHAAMLHPNTEEADNYAGYLDGWAQVTSMGNNGWVRLKDPSGTHYGVTSSTRGLLSGYGWNSGTEDAFLGNSGLGWLKLSGLKVGDCKLGCATKQICLGQTIPGTTCDSSYCSGSSTACTLGSDKLSWTCSNSCGDVSCNIHIINPEVGVCGSLSGKYICDSANPPAASKLCSDPATYNDDLNASGVTATWTCGNDCGTKVTCTASAKCGWTETAP
ncbi:MAG: hypothetical protein WC643_03555, partial [Parcubacteria group bacterium]